MFFYIGFLEFQESLCCIWLVLAMLVGIVVLDIVAFDLDGEMEATTPFAFCSG